MTEAEKIKVRRPTAYESVPMPPANGAAEEEIPKLPVGLPHIREAVRLSQQAPPPDLISAVGAVFRAVQAEIARHEKSISEHQAQISKLRESLAPFASMSRQSAAPADPSDQATLEALLRFAQAHQTEQP